MNPIPAPKTLPPVNQMPVPEVAQDLNKPQSLNCKHCHYQILSNYFFCPNCGKKLKNPPLAVTVSKQIYIYFISAAFPPLGLWPGIKYLLDKRPKAKIIGTVAIILTLLSTVITIQLTMSLLNGQKDVASQQLQQLEGAGY